MYTSRMQQSYKTKIVLSKSVSIVSNICPKVSELHQAGLGIFNTLKITCKHHALHVTLRLLFFVSFLGCWQRTVAILYGQSCVCQIIIIINFFHFNPSCLEPNYILSLQSAVSVSSGINLCLSC